MTTSSNGWKWGEECKGTFHGKIEHFSKLFLTEPKKYVQMFEKYVQYNFISCASKNIYKIDLDAILTKFTWLRLTLRRRSWERRIPHLHRCGSEIINVWHGGAGRWPRRLWQHAPTFATDETSSLGTSGSAAFVGASYAGPHSHATAHPERKVVAKFRDFLRLSEKALLVWRNASHAIHVHYQTLVAGFVLWNLFLKSLNHMEYDK